MPDFTQGKWVYDEPFGVIFCDETCAVIARVQEAGTGSCFCLTPEGQANARLIACAPKLYEFLREELVPTSDYRGTLGIAREAKIRKVIDYIDGKENAHDKADLDC